MEDFYEHDAIRALNKQTSVSYREIIETHSVRLNGEAPKKLSSLLRVYEQRLKAPNTINVLSTFV